MDLRTIPVLAINLERCVDRRANLIDVLRRADCGNVEFVPPVDGSILAKANGHVRHVKSGLYRLTYDASPVAREARVVKLSKTLQSMHQKALVNIWSLHGCAASHLNAMRRAIELLNSGCGAVLVVEDDIVISEEWRGRKIRASVRKITKSLFRSFPEWQILFLGGHSLPCWAHSSRNGPTDIDGLHHGECIVQTHAYMLRCPNLAAALADKLLNKGLVADGAISSSLIYGKSFFLQPQLFMQGAFQSELQLTEKPGQAGWREAYRLNRSACEKRCKSTSVRKMAKLCRKPVSKRKRKFVCKRNAKLGGGVHAGSGSSAQDIKKKEGWMNRARVKTGRFPTQREAKRHNISWALWKRIIAG
jgi:GR25 family glycosyltransferase involved in LPS biosynthesis